MALEKVKIAISSKNRLNLFLSSRWICVFPFILFFYTAYDYSLHNTLGEIMWICNAGCALLGVSILTGWPLGIWIATLSIIAGIVPWLGDEILNPQFALRSLLLHFAGGSLGIFRCRHNPLRGRAYPYAFIFWIALQIASHFLTRPDLNVNVSHHSQGLDISYWIYWPIAASLWTFGLGAVEYFIRKSMMSKTSI